MISTVQLPVAIFRERVRDFGDNDAELAAWVRAMSRCLVYNDGSEQFATELLAEVERWRARKAAKMRDYRAREKASPRPQTQGERLAAFYANREAEILAGGDPAGGNDPKI